MAVTLKRDLNDMDGDHAYATPDDIEETTMFYMNAYSATIILVSIIGIGLLIYVATDATPWAEKLNSTPAGKRAATLSYWMLCAVLVGQILRAFTPNWIFLLVLAAGSAYGLWRLALMMMQRNLAAVNTSLSLGVGLMLAGIVCGALVRQLLSWQGSLPVIVAVMAVALFVLRPRSEQGPQDLLKEGEV